MIRSMTGFGRCSIALENMDILAEVRSVNHRYLEMNVRLPHAYSYLEDKLKKLVQQKAARGKVDISLTIQLHGTDGLEVDVNGELAASYIKALRGANEKFSLTDDLTLTSIMRFPDIFTVRKVQLEEEAVWAAVEPAMADAVEKFAEMRAAEGERLLDDLLRRLETLEQMVSQIEVLAPETAKRYYDKLYTRLSELLGDREIDESRIVTEAAVFADKIAVDEETVRLHSHIAQFRSLLELNEPVGRKLDFLVQEMNREVNTTGSKAQDITITRLVVDMKSEIEKIREQIQNIE
ncbi:MAG: YicC family protein [Oscillospiraceae bacterium]|nr:YicC family protein [Oscillospiraceae bacterium]